MPVSVFVGTSVDGFIARPDGALDFLPPGGGEPHGYDEFIATVDAIVIGRKTFETVLAMEAWPYGNKRVVVLSSGPSIYPRRVAWWNRWTGLRPKSFRNWRRAELIIFMSTAGSRSTFPACGTRPAPRYHARARAHWRRDSSLRHPAPRHPPKTRSHSALPQRPGAERVPGGRLGFSASVHLRRGSGVN